MGMTQKERQAKRILIKTLDEDGYGPYGDLISKFDINLEKDPRLAAAMIPGKGVIIINWTLRMDQISVVVRHEILHEYLAHSMRLLRKLNAPSLQITAYKKVRTTPDDVTFDDLKKLGYNHRKANYAMDYDISNQGYTEEDKEIVRQLELNGKIVSGLVTEDDHPEWIDLSMEEMYDELMKEMQKDPDPQDQQQDPQPKGEGGDSTDGNGGDDGGNSGNGGNDDPEKGDDTENGGDGGSDDENGGKGDNNQPGGNDGKDDDDATGGNNGPGGNDDDDDDVIGDPGPGGPGGNDDDDDATGGNNGPGGDGGTGDGSDSPKTRVIGGKFIDSKTFVTDDGKEIKL